MASTATGSRAHASPVGRAPPRTTALVPGALLALEALWALVPATVGADDVGELGHRALRAHGTGRRLQHPVGCAAAAALRLGGLLLRDGHRQGILGDTAALRIAQHVQGRPAGIAR